LPVARRRLKIRTLADARQVAPLLSGLPSVVGVEPAAGGWLSVYTSGDDRFVAEVVRYLVGHGVPIVAVEPERNELERIFLEVTKGSLQ
jgi:ABC-2 type transport system ATP-binding protein